MATLYISRGREHAHMSACVKGKGKDAHRTGTREQRKDGKILHEISLHEGQKTEKHPRTQETEAPVHRKSRDFLIQYSRKHFKNLSLQGHIWTNLPTFSMFSFRET